MWVPLWQANHFQGMEGLYCKSQDQSWETQETCQGVPGPMDNVPFARAVWDGQRETHVALEKYVVEVNMQSVKYIPDF